MTNEKMYLCPECEGEAIKGCDTCSGEGEVTISVIVKVGNKLELEERANYIIYRLAPELHSDESKVDIPQVIDGINPLLSEFLSGRDILMFEAYFEEMFEKGYFIIEEEF